MTNKEKILEGLNNAQREVVTHIKGSYIILATAGAGKTFSMVRRTAYMIANGISASQILIFTFTRKASQELKDRVEKLMGAAAKGVQVSTYHSFCAHTLRRYAKYLGFTSSFSIYGDSESLGIISKIIKENGYTVKANKAQKAISHYKEEMMTPERAEIKVSISGSHEDAEIVDIYKEYQKVLKTCNALDYDDLIFQMVKLLEERKDIRREINDQYRYLMVDEFQDSSTIDLRMISLLAGPDSSQWNLAAIGDIDQSIYGFRGANVPGVLKFIKDYNLTQLNMGQNYRSTKTIVEASDKLIRANQLRIEKEVFTDNEQGDKISFCTVSNSFDEANTVADIVKDCVDRGYAYKDIAVLYRMNYQSYDLEKSFMRKDIPYRVLKGLAFAKRREVQDIMAYIQLVINSHDREAFKRIINVPNRFVGEKSVEKILSANPFMNVLEACERADLKQKRTKDGVLSFLTLMRHFQEVAGEVQNDPDITAFKLVESIIDETKYYEYCEEYSANKKEYYERLGNLEALKTIAENYYTIEEFTEAVLCSVNDNDDQSSDDTVTFSTMHSSKGLEWPIVIIVGCNEGTTPSTLDLLDGGIEEARRLLYVAMTRAKQELYLTRAKTIMKNQVWLTTKVSRFISEIPQRFLKKV